MERATPKDHSQGRPSVELHSIIGLMMIRRLHNWTVTQTHEAILFRSDIQYALNLEPGIDIAQPTIERSLQKMQRDEQLSEEFFARVTDPRHRPAAAIAGSEGQNTAARLDARAQRRGRDGASLDDGGALRRFFHQLKRHDTAMFDRAPDDLPHCDRISRNAHSTKIGCELPRKRTFTDANFHGCEPEPRAEPSTPWSSRQPLSRPDRRLA